MHKDIFQTHHVRCARAVPPQPYSWHHLASRALCPHRARALHACLLISLDRVILLHIPSISLSQYCSRRECLAAHTLINPVAITLVSPFHSPHSHITYLRRRPHRPHHALQQLHPCDLSRLSEPNAHVLQERRVPDVAAQRVALHVGHPFELCGVGAADADEARLLGFKLLLGAEFVGHLRKEVLYV
jgi:hypothetical protein